MPALQVRDFPADLYEDLKRFAAREHRSMAQQTIKAVEDMLRREDVNTHDANVIEFDSLAARQRRIEKRKILFERIHENAKNLPKDMTPAVEVIREMREERDRHLCEVMGIPYIPYDDADEEDAR